MVTRISILLLALAVSGCAPQDFQPSKPWVVVSKAYWEDSTCMYTYRGANYGERSFREINNKYSIGDTIK